MWLMEYTNILLKNGLFMIHSNKHESDVKEIWSYNSFVAVRYVVYDYLVNHLVTYEDIIYMYMTWTYYYYRDYYYYHNYYQYYISKLVTGTAPHCHT